MEQMSQRKYVAGCATDPLHTLYADEEPLKAGAILSLGLVSSFFPNCKGKGGRNPVGNWTRKNKALWQCSLVL